MHTTAAKWGSVSQRKHTTLERGGDDGFERARQNVTRPLPCMKMQVKKNYSRGDIIRFFYSSVWERMEDTLP